MELLVVGAGGMGRWLASSVGADVAFADVDPDAASAAADELGGRAVALDAAERFDAVCVAVPMSAAAEAIEEHAERAERAVLDVTGAMADPVAAMAEHAPDRERVSLHPLFAPARAPGNVAMVADEPGPVTDGIRADLEAAGNALFETTPGEHDTAMGTVQARAHAAVLAFALAAEPVRPEFETPVFEALRTAVDHTTGGNPRVYREIQEAFGGATDVALAAERVADADAETFERLYREAGEGGR